MSGKGEGWGSRPLLTPNALSAVAAPSSPFLSVLSQLKQEAEESREGGRRKAPLQTRLKPSLPHLHTQSLSPSLPCFQSFLPRRLFLLPLSLHRQAPKLDQRISNRQNLLLSLPHTLLLPTCLEVPAEGGTAYTHAVYLAFKQEP